MDLYKILRSHLLNYFCAWLTTAALSELVLLHQSSSLFYKNLDRFVFQKIQCQPFNLFVSTLTESCQNRVVIALYYELSQLPDMRWFGFACLLSVLSHLGVRSQQIPDFPFSLLSQYCQISVSPRQVRARGTLVGQQAFSGKFHVGGNCSGRWTPRRVPLKRACSGRSSCRPELLPHAGFTGVCREGKSAARACLLQAIGCPTAF